MKKILTTLLLAATLAAPALADPLPLDLEGRPVSPQWTKVVGGNGGVYFAALNTIERVRGTGPIAGSVSMMVFSQKQREFYTILFDCRGKFRLYSDPDVVRTIREDSMVRIFEKAACAL